MKKAAEGAEDQEFMALLEEGIRKVLSNPKAKASERVAAINAGAKLLAIKHKISDDSGGFFS